MRLTEIGNREREKRWEAKGILHTKTNIITKLFLKGFSRKQIVELLEEPEKFVHEIETRLIQEGKIKKQPPQ